MSKLFFQDDILESKELSEDAKILANNYVKSDFSLPEEIRDLEVGEEGIDVEYLGGQLRLKSKYKDDIDEMFHIIEHSTAKGLKGEEKERVKEQLEFVNDNVDKFFFAKCFSLDDSQFYALPSHDGKLTSGTYTFTKVTEGNKNAIRGSKESYSTFRVD